ncbi:hypothetical protein Zmor_012019 [Zophobas morio]|uniref:Uncharacterized protein n=1 Tax=Zophobas morio TaxID=2755281 RepID=A0AA38HIK0_9CUCU|nr:hypothetical protein Zmor_012019 [Zophobas morio]
MSKATVPEIQGGLGLCITEITHPPKRLLIAVCRSTPLLPMVSSHSCMRKYVSQELHRRQFAEAYPDHEHFGHLVQHFEKLLLQPQQMPLFLPLLLSLFPCPLQAVGTVFALSL